MQPQGRSEPRSRPVNPRLLPAPDRSPGPAAAARGRKGRARPCSNPIRVQDLRRVTPGDQDALAAADPQIPGASPVAS